MPASKKKLSALSLSVLRARLKKAFGRIKLSQFFAAPNFPLLVLLLVLISGIFLHPTLLRASLAKLSCEAYEIVYRSEANFETLLTPTLDYRAFWEWRNRQQPGVFNYNRQAVVFSNNFALQEDALFVAREQGQPLQLFDYHSPCFQSSEGLIHHDFAAAWMVEDLAHRHLLSINEMLTANGFFDLGEVEKQDVEGWWWYVNLKQY